MVWNGHHLKVSASIGLVYYPLGGEIDTDILVQQADEAMYLAKQSGKNRFYLAEPA